MPILLSISNYILLYDNIVFFFYPGGYSLCLLELHMCCSSLTFSTDGTCEISLTGWDNLFNYILFSGTLNKNCNNACFVVDRVLIAANPPELIGKCQIFYMYPNFTN